MNVHLKTRTLLVASIMAAAMTSAQGAGSGSPVGDSGAGEEAPLDYRLALSYRPGFNIKAKFAHPGLTKTDPGPVGKGTHVYDDGYNIDDPPSDPYTWNWGYQYSSQVPGDDYIYMHSSSPAGDMSSSADGDDPQHGLELSIRRYLGRVGKGTWGLAAALDYNHLTFCDKKPLTSSVTRVTDAYALNGVIPPDPPFAGEPPSPENQYRSPLISDTPTRTITSIPGGASITGTRELDANLYGLRLGPYLEFPLSKKFAVSVGGGLALALLDSEFRYQESVTIDGIARPRVSGSGSDSDFLVGGYVGASLSYALSKSWGVFIGAEYQYLSSFSQTVGGREASLDFSKSFFAKVGCSYSF